MTGKLIVTTDSSETHALAYQGIAAFRQYPQISAMLRREFGEEYALLFGEPVENADGGQIDWYSNAQGEPVKLAALPEAEQQGVMERIAAMAAKIGDYANNLAQSPDPLKVTRGRILQLILTYPDKGDIYLVGAQPVLVLWSFAPAKPGVEPKNLARPIAPPAKKDASPQPVPVARPADTPVAAPTPAAQIATPAQSVRSPGWLWWLLPLAACILLLLLLFTSFGNIPPLSGITLLRGPELSAARKDPNNESYRLQLEEEISVLKRQLAEHVALCKPTPVAHPPQNSLIIPPKAVNTEFLAGQWLCETGLINTTTHEPVRIMLSFDENGIGSGVIREKNDVCEGNAQAEMQSNKLIIQLNEQICQSRSHSYAPVRIACENTANAAVCRGVHQGGQAWNAHFVKLQ